MSYREHTTIDGMECDARGCDEAIRIWENIPASIFTSMDILEEEGKAAGWSMWVGRGRRMYCPKHGPSKGSRMRKRWGR